MYLTPDDTYFIKAITNMSTSISAPQVNTANPPDAGAEEGEKRRLLQFVGRFSCSRLGGYIRKLGREELKEFGQRYLRDFLLLTWKISSGDELEVCAIPQ